MKTQILLSVLWLGGTSLVAAPRADAGAGRPNILLIISDDHAWTDYSFMGHPRIQTPHIDQLASEGLTFTRGYVTASLCSPSLVSILTGLYPHQHRITSNDPPMPSAPNRGAAYRDPRYRERRDETIALLKNVPTLPGILAQHGYLSLQTGKWWVGHYTRGGFTHGMTEGDPARGGRHGDAGLRIGRETLQPIYDFIDLSAREEKPFFIWYAPMLPHDPHTPPARFLDRHLQQAPSIHVARYWAMVEWFDETCGALLDHLAQRGLADNTIVAYLADNGWIQSTDNPRYAPKSKQSPYDGGLRTPIILRWPGHVRPERSEMAVSSIDLLPTLLRAVQIVPPANLPGIDLLNPGAGQTRKAVFGACFTHDAIDIQQPARNLRWRWTVADRWKLILPDPVNEPDGAAELYDLTADPHETRNLAQEPGAPLSQLRETADGWWRPHP